MKTLQEAIEFAEKRQENLDILESPGDWPHGKFHAIYSGCSAHFLENAGYILRATVRVKTVTTIIE
jgi:hypothetical protein